MCLISPLLFLLSPSLSHVCWCLPIRKLGISIFFSRCFYSTLSLLLVRCQYIAQGHFRFYLVCTLKAEGGERHKQAATMCAICIFMLYFPTPVLGGSASQPFPQARTKAHGQAGACAVLCFSIGVGTGFGVRPNRVRDIPQRNEKTRCTWLACKQMSCPKVATLCFQRLTWDSKSLCARKALHRLVHPYRCFDRAGRRGAV